MATIVTMGGVYTAEVIGGPGVEVTETYHDGVLVDTRTKEVGGDNYKVYEIRCTTDQVLVPAVPAVDPVFSTSTDLMVGWNAGAESVQSIPGDGYAQFKVSAPNAGTYVGLAAPGWAADPSNIYGMYAGALFNDGVVSENDVEITTFTASDVFRLSKVGGVISLLKNGVTVHEFAGTASGDAVLAASIYQAYDYVDSPLIAAYTYTDPKPPGTPGADGGAGTDGTSILIDTDGDSVPDTIWTPGVGDPPLVDTDADNIPDTPFDPDNPNATFRSLDIWQDAIEGFQLDGQALSGANAGNIIAQDAAQISPLETGMQLMGFMVWVDTDGDGKVDSVVDPANPTGTPVKPEALPALMYGGSALQALTTTVVVPGQVSPNGAQQLNANLQPLTFQTSIAQSVGMTQDAAALQALSTVGAISGNYTGSSLSSGFFPLTGFSEAGNHTSATMYSDVFVDGELSIAINELFAEVSSTGVITSIFGTSLILPASMSSSFSVLDDITPDAVFYALLTETLTVGSDMSANEVLTAVVTSGAITQDSIDAAYLLIDELRSLGFLHDAFAIDSDASAMMLGVLQAITDIASNRDGLSISVNMENSALSYYEEYAFNSYAEIDGEYYGASAGGVYKLQGDTDAGEAIRSMVSMGKQTFGTSTLKRIGNAYVGIGASGDMYLKVILPDDEAYTYKVRAIDENMKTQRFDLGRGLRANYYEFELYNGDGCDFELDSVEFRPFATDRRI